MVVCYTLLRTLTYMPNIPKRHLKRNGVASRGLRRGKVSLSRNCTLHEYKLCPLPFVRAGLGLPRFQFFGFGLSA